MMQERYFDVLYEVVKTVNSTLNGDKVLARIVKATTEATDAKGCSVLLLDVDKKELIHSAAYGLSDDYLRKGNIIADRSLADTMKGETVTVSDVSHDPRIQYPEEAIQEGICSVLCVPLTTKDKIIGEMRIYRSQTEDFPEEIVKLLTAVANLSAIAIENSRIYDSLKKAHDVCQRELWHLQP